ncbi:hypothetical protein J7384_10175 [Endozoicomonas sp. G2_1]|uniref:hypothetical protein n=1 Tax=Endozoicomonas sp. G2_1 TaxID=2821091 RepID=UPI001AD97D97|nr:hypothetical protein [Endozoicomonas sp. G2_1]MBO9490726.1 hypothetical protein [Endozoicomonas sp. G2_1]
METEQNQTHDEIMFNESRDLDAEQSFKQLCADTLKSRGEVPEHIVHLAERVTRVNELRSKWGFTSQDNRQAYYRRRDENAFHKTNAALSAMQIQVNATKRVAKMPECYEDLHDLGYRPETTYAKLPF